MFQHNDDDDDDKIRHLFVHNKMLYSSSYDKTIRVWDIQTLNCTRTLTSPQRPEVKQCIFLLSLLFKKYQ